jgi:hypothetical protein
MRHPVNMSSDDLDVNMSDGSATSGDEYVPVKKVQRRRPPSARTAAKKRTPAKRAAYTEASDDESELDSDADSAEEADARSSEDQVIKAGLLLQVQ